MNRTPRYRTPRSRGFTLVELLVVIVIIGILLGILLPTLGPLLFRSHAFAIASEIEELEGSLEQFKTKFGFLPPSELGDLTNPADLATFKAYLRKIAPNHEETDAQIGAWWTQVGQLLDNDSILVFWLSGLNKSVQFPLTYNFGGDNTYGTADDVFSGFAVGEDPAKYVFFELDQKRLSVHTSGTVARLLQRSIGDIPYVYFNSKTYDVAFYAMPAGNLYPYALQANPWTYYNPDSFQIIAAGVDRDFGVMTPPNPPGFPVGDWFSRPQFLFQRDNVTNFAEGVLEKVTK